MTLVIRFEAGLRPILKHQEHDQSTHGSWAGDGVSFKQDRNSLTMQDKSGQTLASVDFVNLGNNRLDVNSIDSFDEGKGYATKVLEKLYSLFPEDSIFWGKTIVPESTHLAQKFSDKYGRTQFMPWGEGVIAGYEWGQLYGDTTVKKHQEHDQSSHGNWARGVGYEDSDEHPEYDFDSDDGSNIEYYTNVGAWEINDLLRTGKVPKNSNSEKEEIRKYVKSLDTEISKTSTPRDLVLFRGTSGTGTEVFEKLKVGDIYTDKGFVSTTLDIGVVPEFMSTATDGAFDSRPIEKGYVLEISVPKGSKALSVNSYFKNVSGRYGPVGDIREENEHILPRNTKFRVDSISSIDVRGLKDKLIKVSVVDDGK